MKSTENVAPDTGWELVQWPFNSIPKKMCWRKKFFGGTIYIGSGDFDIVTFSYGRDSDASFSSTRRRSNRVVPEAEMMQAIDKWAKTHKSRYSWTDFLNTPI